MARRDEEYDSFLEEVWDVGKDVLDVAAGGNDVSVLALRALAAVSLFTVVKCALSYDLE